MKLSEYIKVGSAYTRSINLERDLGDKDDLLTSSYIPTTRATFTVNTIASALTDQTAPKAWALIGPYGSGKSAFGVFLAKIFGDPKSKTSSDALKKIEQTSKSASKAVLKLTDKTKGMIPIVISGSPESLSLRLAQSLILASKKTRGGLKGKKPSYVTEIENALRAKEDLNTTKLLDWISSHQTYVTKKGFAGSIILIDELGKFLEHDARRRDSKDIFLLQAIAERTIQRNSSPLAIVVLLHQSFEQYVASFGKQLRDEWKKVQGRFENIPFIESSEQIMRILNTAISSTVPKAIKENIKIKVNAGIDIFRQDAGLQNIDGDAQLIKLLVGCYPLHPVTASVLPVLCQKVAQNERTLFTYLSSTEPQGFQDITKSLQVDHDETTWIYPHNLYDYFILNHPGLITDQLSQRRWAEVTTAVERSGDAQPLDINILKTIGILNIVGAQSGIRASKDLIATIFEGQNKAQVTKSIKRLTKRSLITFRKFSNEYRVWQGSDIDLDALLSEQLQLAERVNLAELLNERNAIKPIVARRHTIATGNLRYFNAYFCETNDAIDSIETDGCSLIFCIPRNDEEKNKFLEICHAGDRPKNCLYAVVSTSNYLREAVIETAAYAQLEQTHRELASDPIASREFKDRFDISREREIFLLSEILQQPHKHIWLHAGMSLTVHSNRDLQERLSEILENLYSQAPIIQNEIINRTALSPSGTSARRKLMAAMINNANYENLGIEKSPPEKSVYLSLFKSNGIHRLDQNEWRFTTPKQNNNNFTELWDTIDGLVSNVQEPIAISNIMETLRTPPFGIKDGVLPLLVIAYYLSNKSELALFENAHFSPFLTFEIAERILKKPNEFSLQRFNKNSSHVGMLKAYQEVLSDEDLDENSNDKLSDEITLISAARALAKFMMHLSEYAKSTLRMSKSSSEVREAFFASKSPYKLMFIEIPEKLGFKPFSLRNVNESERLQFADKLSSTVSELRSVHHMLINRDIKQEICDAFGEPHDISIEELKSRLNSNRYRDLQNYTIDTQGLKAFIGRVTDEHGDGYFWIENIANFLARKPTEKWTDDDWETAKFRLTELVAKIRDIEKLRALKPANKKLGQHEDTQVILIRTVAEGQETTDKIAILNQNRIKELEQIAHEVEDKLDRLNDNDLANAVLAMILRKDKLKRKTSSIKQKARKKTND